MSRALKDALENLNTRKSTSILNLRQNLRSNVFSARSSQSIINVINLSKTNDCECNSSSIISIGNQKAREIIRIWTKHAWNYSLISLVTIWYLITSTNLWTFWVSVGVMIGNHVIMTEVSYYFQLKDYFKYVSHRATTTLTRVMQTQIAPENNQLLLLFYSEGSSCSAQAFSISSQVSSDKSVECIEKENLICNSVTSDYCYSPVLNKTQIPLTQRRL